MELEYSTLRCTGQDFGLWRVSCELLFEDQLASRTLEAGGGGGGGGRDDDAKNYTLRGK